MAHDCYMKENYGRNDKRQEEHFNKFKNKYEKLDNPYKRIWSNGDLIETNTDNSCNNWMCKVTYYKFLPAVEEFYKDIETEFKKVKNDTKNKKSEGIIRIKVHKLI